MTTTMIDRLESRRLLSAGLAPQSAPNAPSNLAGVAVTSNKVKLTWADNSSNETSFYGERSNDPNFSAVVFGTLAANATKFADVSALPGKTYYYRIRSLNDSGNSGWSNVFSITMPPPTSLHINAGGNAFTDSGNTAWSAESGFGGGSVSTSDYDVLGTTDDSLYQTRRVGSGFTYSLPVANGSYALKLLFAEPVWTAAGKRKFNVSAEGNAVLTNYDIFADAGAQTAIAKSFGVTISDGKIDLSFTKVTDNAIISAFSLMPIAPQPSTINWATAANAPVPRLDSQSAVVGNVMYVFGGFDPNFTTISRNDAYDLTTNTWSPRADMPEPLSHAGVAVDGTDIWVAGGFIGVPGNQIFGTRHVWKYDTIANTWTAGPELPQARGAGAMAIVGRELHFFGGSNFGRTQDTVDHWALDLASASPTWKTKASLPSPRNHLGAATVNGKIYAVGGQLHHDDDAIVQSIVECYDPATNSWTRVADLPRPRSHITSATFAMNGRLIVVGGDTTSQLAVNDVSSFDPSSGLWTALTPLPARRMATTSGVIGTKIFVTGGSGAGVTSDLSWLGDLI